MKLWGVILISVATSVALVVPMTTYTIRQDAQVMQEAKAFDGFVVKVLDLQVLERGRDPNYREFRLVVGTNADAKRFVWYINKYTQPGVFLEENAVIPGDTIAVSYRGTVTNGSHVSIFTYLTFSKSPP